MNFEDQIELDKYPIILHYKIFFINIESSRIF